jgi:hypothetical protein
MSSTLGTPVVLDNNVSLTAGAGENSHTSALWTKNGGYGAGLSLKFTNGATGPTVAAQAQVQQSPDNSNWYNLGGVIGGPLGANGSRSLSVDIPIWVKYARVLSGSNTDQAVVIRCEVTEVTAVQ